MSKDYMSAKSVRAKNERTSFKRDVYLKITITTHHRAKLARNGLF